MPSLSFAAVDAALDAGWYLLWRLFLWMFCSLFILFAVAYVLLHGDLVSPRIVDLLSRWFVHVGVLVGLVAWLLRLNRVVDAWTRARHGRDLAKSIRWSLSWRAGLAGFGILSVAGILLTLAEDVAGAHPRILRVLEFVIFAAGLIASTIGVGWAMLTVVAKQIRQNAKHGTR